MLVELTERELFRIVAALETEKRAITKYHRKVDMCPMSPEMKAELEEVVELRNKLRDTKP